MGIIVFGIGVGSKVALAGALLHTLNHAVTKALLFLAYGNISRSYEAAGIAGQPTGVLRTMPRTGWITSIGGLALVGAPPFSIFFSELTILWGACNTIWQPLMEAPTLATLGHISIWLNIGGLLVFVIATTSIFFGLCRHLSGLALGRAAGERRLDERWDQLAPLLLLLGAVVALGVWIAPPLTRLIGESVALIYPENTVP
jgi:hydrogenase-4 component F